jgi:hypothetical protein
MRLVRVVAPLLLCACDPPERAALIQAEPPALQRVPCIRGTTGSVAIVLCDMTGNPEALRRFQLGELMPPRERRLRRASALRFGLGVEAQLDAPTVKGPTETGSYLDPFDDQEAERFVAGWALLDRGIRLAMLLLSVDERLGLIISEFPAASLDNVTQALRALDFDQNLTELSRGLKEVVRFSAPEPAWRER